MVITLNSEKKHLYQELLLPPSFPTRTRSLYPAPRILLPDSRFFGPASEVLQFNLEISCDYLQTSQAAA